MTPSPHVSNEMVERFCAAYDQAMDEMGCDRAFPGTVRTALTAALSAMPGTQVPEGLIERIARYDPKKVAPAALREDIMELSCFLASPTTAQEG